MIWINFLHFYQPANSEDFVIKEATEKSYKRVIAALEKNPEIRFTLNITGCLVIRWAQLGYMDVIKRIKELVRKGQIELVGSAAYHPLLPLVNLKEVETQIIKNEKIIKKYFGVKPTGFFFPEMAYGKKAALIVKKLSYHWAILDEISANGRLRAIDYQKKYLDKNSGLEIIFRSRKQSSAFVPRLILDDIRDGKPKDIYVTATDGELYGLRHIDHNGEFEKLLKMPQLETRTISKHLKKLKQIEEVRVVPSTWESSEKELKHNKPYILWYNQENEIQKKIWELADMAYKIVEKYRADKNYKWGRWHLVRGLSSCTFWWASQKNSEHVFGPYAWNPDEINKRINELIKAIRSFEEKTKLSTKIRAEKLALEIKGMVWEKHWRMKHRKQLHLYVDNQ